MSDNKRPFRNGDVVEVRSAEEILASLDEHGALDAMPFMPEMLRFVGGRFRVSRRVEKICDTVAGSGSRRMTETVYLDDLRCDGSAHGGCQAGCRIYWKEAWLRHADDVEHTGAEMEPEVDERESLEELLTQGTTTVREGEEQSVDAYRCQATEAFVSTSPLRLYDPAQYMREIRTGNVGLLHFTRVAVRALTGRVGHRLGLKSRLPLQPRDDLDLSAEALDLQPGEWVQIRPAEEIAATLDSSGRNRGLWFDEEMLQYCGGTFRVKARVNRIIDEPSGQMLEFGSDCIVLEGVVCTGDFSTRRWFCPRAIYPYWREAWLCRVEAPAGFAFVDEPTPAEPTTVS